MTTLLESRARPFGSSKGVVLSMVIHGALIAGAVYATSQVILPPHEKVEEHPILYVATPPPKPIEIAPAPLPKVTPPPKAKASEKVFKAPPAQKRAAPTPRTEPRPVQPQPRVPSTPALVAPTRVSVTLPPINPNAVPTISDVVAPPVAAPIKASSIGSGGSSRGSDAGSGGSKGGLSSGSSGEALSENQVDRAVVVTQKSDPRYPESLRSVGVEGTVVMRFIVGTNGRVEPGSIQVISSPHNLFSEAVKRALLNTRFRPAEAGGQKVRQLVEQPFSFKLAT